MQPWRSGTGGSANSPRTWVNPAPNSRNVTGKSPSSLLRSVSFAPPRGFWAQSAPFWVSSCLNFPDFPGPSGRLTALLAERDSGLRKLRAELAKCDATIRIFTVELGQRHTQIGELTADVELLSKKLQQREAELEARDTQIRENEAEIRRLKELLEEKESAASELRQELEAQKDGDVGAWGALKLGNFTQFSSTLWDFTGSFIRSIYQDFVGFYGIILQDFTGFCGIILQDFTGFYGIILRDFTGFSKTRGVFSEFYGI
ncbi:uncharacterized protein LOC118700853 isoform X2 [Molothrus ater]|uniref:uncharacterized protein LOC118700853 isoform X2 n=1 Tax=Molothrus ater TaxID=84834 RepID=UPI0023E79248|nr:uncharacterized protein LOC118700853 isoform X2 [Molothrus ater]